MLDAYCLGRPAADVSALELRQALRLPRNAVPQGPAGARLRDRHQLQPLHLLHHGGKLHDDADAGHRARRVRPQSFLQEQLPVPAMDRRRRHPRLPRASPRLRDEVRGKIRHGSGRARARRGARAEGPRRQPLRAIARKPNLAEEASARARRRALRGDRPTTICGAPCPRSRGARHGRGERARRGRDSGGKLGLPEENMLYFMEKTGAAARRAGSAS